MEEKDLISKTRRKRQMKELQDVGAALVKLSPEQLAHIDLPETLREAVLACRGFTKHEAIRRQVSPCAVVSIPPASHTSPSQVQTAA